MNMAKTLTIFSLLLIVMPGISLAVSEDMYVLGNKAAEYAVEQLDFEKGDSDILALTNAGYVVIDGQTTGRCLDAITDVTGCSVGSENLLSIQNAPWKQLWFGFFNKETGYAVYLKVNNSALAADNPFEVMATDKIDAEYLLANVDEWDANPNKDTFNHMLPICNVWTHPNTPWVYMKAVDLHNHICPGISSGFIEAVYVESKLPIENPATQSYKVISCPCWCKEDYFQVAWDATPGKRGMYVMHLSNDEQAGIKDRYNGTGAGGIFIRWDSSTNSGDGLVLGFSWPESDADLPSWASRLNSDLEIVENAENPELYVTTLKEFHLESSDDLTVLQSAGVNPYKVLGLVK